MNLFTQMASGVAHVHANKLIHRDIKPANFLLSLDGTVKLGDFGLTTDENGDNGRLTHAVCTRWYRPPELLFGSTTYTQTVDTWGLGCCLGEMFLAAALFPGTSDIDQVIKVMSFTGTPDVNNTGFGDLPDWDKLVLPDFKGREVSERLLKDAQARLVSKSNCITHFYCGTSRFALGAGERAGAESLQREGGGVGGRIAGRFAGARPEEEDVLEDAHGQIKY